MALASTFRATGDDTTGTGFSFDFDCGAAAADKVAVLALHHVGGLAGKLITAIAVDGVDCLANVVQGRRHAGVWCALPSSAGVVTVNLTYDSNVSGAFSWGAWTITGSTGSPADTQSVFGTDAVRSLNMTIAAGGVAIVSGTSSNSNPVTTTNAAEDYDTANATMEKIGAHTASTGAVTVTFNQVSSMVGFAFDPAPVAQSLVFNPNPMLPLLVR